MTVIDWTCVAHRLQVSLAMRTTDTIYLAVVCVSIRTKSTNIRQQCQCVLNREKLFIRRSSTAYRLHLGLENVLLLNLIWRIESEKSAVYCM